MGALRVPAVAAATALLLVLLAACARASVYPVRSNAEWVPPFQHAEKMFASDRGPVLSRAGNSSVSVRSPSCGRAQCVAALSRERVSKLWY